MFLKPRYKNGEISSHTKVGPGTFSQLSFGFCIKIISKKAVQYTFELKIFEVPKIYQKFYSGAGAMNYLQYISL
jgi:hypothetical protein